MSISALFYFLYPEEVIAVVVGITGIFSYMCYMQYLQVKSQDFRFQIAQFLISLFAVIAVCILAYLFLTDVIQRWRIFRWFIIASFLIATAGTIFPFANAYKESHKFIFIIYYIIFIATIIKAPESFNYSQNTTLTNEEVQIIEGALVDYKTSTNYDTENIKNKILKNKQNSDLDLFILCISSILAGLTLVAWSDKIKVKVGNKG